MAKKQGRQKGAQAHAEGQHGEKTHQRFLEELHSGASGEKQGRQEGQHEGKGRHQLFEGRQQLDEADFESQKNRLSRDVDRHGHTRENFQIEGGAESHPVMPRSHTNPQNPDAPNPRSGLGPDEIPQRVRKSR